MRRPVNDSGTLVGTAQYAAFGGVRSSSGAGSAFGFTGELTDPTTGLVHLRARDYNPATGRFVSMDTVQPNAPGTQGYNRCAYVANNPATWTDPSGNALGRQEGCEGAVGSIVEIARLFGVYALVRGSILGKGRDGAFLHVISAGFTGFGMSQLAVIAALNVEGTTGDLPPIPHYFANVIIGGLTISMTSYRWGNEKIAAPAAFGLLLAGVLIALAAIIIEQLIMFKDFLDGIAGKLCSPLGPEAGPRGPSVMSPNGSEPHSVTGTLSLMPRLPAPHRPSTGHGQ